MPTHEHRIPLQRATPELSCKIPGVTQHRSLITRAAFSGVSPSCDPQRFFFGKLHHPEIFLNLLDCADLSSHGRTRVPSRGPKFDALVAERVAFSRHLSERPNGSSFGVAVSKKDISILLFGKSYWKSISNMQAMADASMISQNDCGGISRLDAVYILRGNLF